MAKGRIDEKILLLSLGSKKQYAVTLSKIYCITFSNILVDLLHIKELVFEISELNKMSMTQRFYYVM